MAPGPSAIPTPVRSLCANGVIHGCHALLEAPCCPRRSNHLPGHSSSWPRGTASRPPCLYLTTSQASHLSASSATPGSLFRPPSCLGPLGF